MCLANALEFSFHQLTVGNRPRMPNRDAPNRIRQKIGRIGKARKRWLPLALKLRGAEYLRGVWSCMKHELRQMERQGRGAIVNNASVGALTGNPGIASYIASKHGVVG